jgi:hypothetical protein
MRRFFRPVPLAALLALATLTLPMAEARAQQRLGSFQSWTAATHTEGGHKVCYAFARASKSEGVPNRKAHNVLLVVTHRPQGRDQVALQAGYTYPRTPDGAADPVQVTAGGPALGFFTAGNSAFARNGGAAVAAFRNGREAVARGPGPNGRGQASDTFSLSGFTAAYEAISKACPAEGGGRR